MFSSSWLVEIYIKYNKMFTVFARAGADCHLGAEEISQTNRVFAFRGDDQLYPLRLDVVRTHQTLEMFCSNRDVVHTTCQQNGRLKPPLPLSDCSNPPKSTVEVVSDESCPHTMYRVGYKLNDQQFLELYRSCYDPGNQTAHFVKHLVYPSMLSRLKWWTTNAVTSQIFTIPADIARPEQAFTTDGVISSAGSASFQAKHIYSRFQELLGSHQTFVSSRRELVFDRGHLAPSVDFGFEQYMRQTFKYINVVAQFRRINRSNWKTIENWIRKQLNIGFYPALQVCTGALGVLQLPDSRGDLKAIYLGAKRSNPIPKWLFKIVSDGAGTHLAFLTYNNIHDIETLSPNCRQVSCPFSLQLIPNREAGLSFCCDPIDFIRRNVPHLANVC